MLLLDLSEAEWPPSEWNAPPALPSIDDLTSRRGPAYDTAHAVYSGPTPRSNWILPGRVLCGGAPHAFMSELVKAGVTCFVSLQAKGEAKPYRDGAHRLSSGGPEPSFLEQPIADQSVTSDEQVAALVLRVLARVLAGDVCYIHCRGGHGRTGTVCALLLGLLHNLDGPAALAHFQALHDTRKMPCFAAAEYTPSADGRSCVALFEVQRAQVLRLLAPASTPPIARGLSGAYGRGASQYDEVTLVEWKTCGEAASQAARERREKATCQGQQETASTAGGRQQLVGCGCAPCCALTMHCEAV